VGSSTRSRSWSVTTADLALRGAEKEALATEASAFSRALPDPAARARYERLASAATAGSVPEDLLAPLETMLELLLRPNTERATQRQVLLGIFARTPRGKALAEATSEVNAALRALQGQRIESIRLSAGPGAHSLVLETDRCRVTIEIGASGAQITQLETG
jgi:hypothetical protein